MPQLSTVRRGGYIKGKAILYSLEECRPGAHLLTYNVSIHSQREQHLKHRCCFVGEANLMRQLTETSARVHLSLLTLPVNLALLTVKHEN